MMATRELFFDESEGNERRKRERGGRWRLAWQRNKYSDDNSRPRAERQGGAAIEFVEYLIDACKLFRTRDLFGFARNGA